MVLQALRLATGAQTNMDKFFLLIWRNTYSTSQRQSISLKASELHLMGLETNTTFNDNNWPWKSSRSVGKSLGEIAMNTDLLETLTKGSNTKVWTFYKPSKEEWYEMLEGDMRGGKPTDDPF